jgi:flavin reductase (DIM6/NTAB) family NADH-FMN oxidoreductase RutF
MTSWEYPPPAGVCLDLYRRLAMSVTLVTSRGRAGPVGLTATAVTSLSLQPPLLLACLSTGSRTLAAIRVQQAFAVHMLRESQHDYARAFAAPASEANDKFAAVAWHDVLGVPVVENTLAWAVCFVEEDRQYGDHSIVVGRVVSAQISAGQPLLWHDRTFRHLAPDRGEGARV